MDFKSFFTIIFSLFWSLDSYSCKFSQEIVSLSGPMTMTLESLGLTRDPKLLAISAFHKLGSKFSGDTLAGGIFLAKRTLNKYKNSFIFFDKSKDLSRELERLKFVNKTEVYTLGQNPYETVKYTLRLLKPLTIGCDNKFRKLEKEINLAEESLSIPKGTYYFFLGRIGYKLPNLLIANDMFVLSLKNINNFSTYKTSLNYVPWSKKILESEKKHFKIGISESSDEKLKISFHQGGANLSSRGILIPGIRQVELLTFFSSKEFQSYVNKNN